jgi:D-mannonate dehydratase
MTDEKFNFESKLATMRKEPVESLNRKRQILITNPYRNQVIEEVAQHVEKLKSFGQPTVDGLAIYIRAMKE